MGGQTNRLFGGIDEAGRGCLVSDLVVAGVSVSRRGVDALVELGVRDSKALSPKRRKTLCGEILRVAERVSIFRIRPREIDEAVMSGKKYRKLNHLEALYFAKVADRLGAAQVIVDAADAVPERFRSVIAKNMKTRCRVAAFHKADRDYPVVSAASIVAKVERDRAVAKLREKHGDFGSGYPSDPRTRAFFEEVLRRRGPLPDYVRRSWKTLDRIQQTLLD